MPRRSTVRPVPALDAATSRPAVPGGAGAGGGHRAGQRVVPSSSRVDSDVARLLELVTPAGFEQFHVDASDPAPAPELPPPTEPDVARMVSAIGRYGAEILGPPLSPRADGG